MKARDLVLAAAVRLTANRGVAGISMRDIAHSIGTSQSVLYYYFKSKDDLLRKMFDETNIKLGKKRAQLETMPTTKEMLRQRIRFQLDHSEEIVAVLKYYLYYRTLFPKMNPGFFPDKAYLHITEVLKRGIREGEIDTADDKKDAKVIAHAINGFLLEYYPYVPKGEEKEILINSILDFLWKALQRR